jgi:hypothetical protein
MISEKMIKDKFIADTVKRNLSEMQSVQLKILAGADERIRRKFDIPAIEQSIRSNVVSINGSNGNFIISQRILKKMRFLDMKKFGNLKIYNKKVWGYVYNDIADELKYGFSEEIKAGIRQELEQAFQPNT